MAKGIIDNSGKKIEFEPPAPTVNKRGGIYAETVEDTSGMTEVVIGGDGKGYVPKVDLSDYVTKEDAEKMINKLNTSKQNKLVAGDNITLTENENGTVTINAIYGTSSADGFISLISGKIESEVTE